MTDGMCPGVCNNRWRRAWGLYRITRGKYDEQLARLAEGAKAPEPPRPPSVQPAWGDPVWCGTCRGMIRQYLDDLDDLASSLAALPPGIRRAIDNRADPVKVSRSRETPSPSPAVDVLDDLAGWLRGWEATARDSDRRPRRGDLSTEITAMSNWLVAHLDPLLRRADHAEAFGAQALRWHRDLISLTHSGRQARHVKQPCPARNCGRYTLWETPGETYVQCMNPACNALLTREELARAS